LDGSLAVTGDISVDGNLDVVGAGTFDTLEVNDLTVLMSVWLPECPQGYLRDESREDIILCVRGRDEMVKVGDFWVDRYEASVWSDAACSETQYGGGSDNYPATFPDSGSFTTPLYACSRSGVAPSRELTWFQAQAACAASGKSLITNAEWQMAVEGTMDLPADALNPTRCLTVAAGPRSTRLAGSHPGGGDSCISNWGAEDMIGNLWEWTSDWWQAGRGWMPGDGEIADSWPDGYSSDNQDGTWNLDGRAHRGDFPVNGLPAAGLRGGSWRYATQAGAFAFMVEHAPSSPGVTFGFRCARSY
jgi:formylglycine-generating enzyme required for sulfatase activity